MKEYKFSIILAVYNVEKYLVECVDSLLKQTFSDYEIILVDDGSTDQSPFLCDRLAEEHACVKVLHKENGGASTARNEGTKIAKGEYILYLDSDDFVLSEEFLEEINKKTASEPDMVFYKFVKYFDDTGKMESCKFSYQNAMHAPDYETQIKMLVADNAFYGMAWVRAIKKSLLIENGILFEEGIIGEDMEWNYHVICNATSMEFIDEPFIAYRQRPNSVTKTKNIKILKDFVYILEKWAGVISQDNQTEKLQTALYGTLAKYYCNLLVTYSRLTDKTKRNYKKRIKKLSWVLKYGVSRRPKLISKIYYTLGFNLTIFMLRIVDKVK